MTHMLYARECIRLSSECGAVCVVSALVCAVCVEMEMMCARHTLVCVCGCVFVWLTEIGIYTRVCAAIVLYAVTKFHVEIDRPGLMFANYHG